MRRSLPLLAAAAVLLNSTVASAGYVCPPRCGVAVTGEGAACQFRFRQDGGLDQMTVSITLRDCFDVPNANCDASVTITPNAGTLALCVCGPNRKMGWTNGDGALQFAFSQIGGRGSVDVCVTAYSCGANPPTEIACVPLTFTSSDLDASCDLDPASAVSVIDLGIWASGLPPGYAPSSDYDCSGVVDVIDLAVWAGGLGLGCAP